MVIYMIGAFLITGVTAGLFMWGILTKQFKEDERLKRKPLEEDEE
jgi:nitrogen fixation-related uncharacterized protein